MKKDVFLLFDTACIYEIVLLQLIIRQKFFSYKKIGRSGIE